MLDQNSILEITNGAISVLSFSLILFLIIYLAFDIRREGFSVKNFFLVSTAASLTLALLTEKTGTLVTRATIWIWRMGGGKVPFSDLQNSLLLAGAVFTAIGLTMMIRILSRPRFGNWPWVLAATLSLSYFFGAVVFNLLTR